MSSDAQKEAYKRYNKNKNTFALVYGKKDKMDGLRLDAYLETIDISTNEYLKALVKRDLDNKGIAYPESQEQDA